jgi:putative sterol carrier protein
MKKETVSQNYPTAEVAAQSFPTLKSPQNKPKILGKFLDTLLPFSYIQATPKRALMNSIRPGRREAMADQMTPEMFMNFVKTASENDLKAQVHAAGVEQVLDGMFQAMREHFLPEKAQGVDAIIQYVVTDEGQEYAYTLAIKDGTCVLKKEKAGNPKVTLSLDLVSFLKLMAGAADGMTLYMSGKLGVSGDLSFSQRIAGFFAAG